METQRVVVCVDGIVSSAVRPFTAGIGWQDFASLLRQRRPDLEVVHLVQPYDWLEILTGKAAGYDELVRKMVEDLRAQPLGAWREVVALGFSLGGLTALNVAHQLTQTVGGMRPEYLAYVTFGAPFGGTKPLSDELLKKIRISYLERIYARRATLLYFRELVAAAQLISVRIMLHAIENDELVAEESALLPSEWLDFAQPGGDLRWGTYGVPMPWPRFRPHDTLLRNPVSIAYIDGLIDGLLPPDRETRYEPVQTRRGRAIYARAEQAV